GFTRMSAKAGLDARRQWLIVAIVITIAAFAIRAVQFGNPLIQVDENFYLLVGDRMWQGALPYVDIWDRKPIGLFLIFAAIRLLGGDGIIQYQIVATLFAAGTALLIARIAVRMAGIVAATVAGIFYILLIGLVGGSGGQAPVFYNLLVAGAALLTLNAQALEPSDASARRIRRLGCVAMLLLGVAMQIKYTVVFEGIFFGLALLHRSWRISGRSPRFVIDALIWVAIALAPTALAFGYYAWRGEAQAFVYANFLSIGARGDADAGELLKRLSKIWLAIHLPMFAVLLSVLLEPWRRVTGGPAAFAFVMAWLGAAFAGFLIFGTYFDHYALPLFVPMAAACAPLFSYRRHYVGLIAASFLLIAGAIAHQAIARSYQKTRGNAQVAEAVVAAMRPRLTNCPYIFNGDSVFYHLAKACLPGRYPFPSHLNLKREAQAIGIDPIAEIRRIMARRPNVVVEQETRSRDISPVAEAVFTAEVKRAYRPVAIIPLSKNRIVVYERIKGR
ncbi:MAG: hypothetical protein JWR77_1034, partial [Rhizorhabdus sp.]|nr:hypothetical protein [Rhizorhabdus sp.]